MTMTGIGLMLSKTLFISTNVYCFIYYVIINNIVNIL
jgi:hypothetical protein